MTDNTPEYIRWYNANTDLLAGASPEAQEFAWLICSICGDDKAKLSLCADLFRASIKLKRHASESLWHSQKHLLELS